MPFRYSRSTRNTRSSRGTRSIRNTRSSRGTRSNKNSVNVRNVLGVYIKVYKFQDESGYTYLHLSRPNIKLLSLFILATIGLDSTNRAILYDLVLSNNNPFNDNQLQAFHKVMNNILGSGLEPIVYDNSHSQQTMLDFVSSNDILTLCKYNGRQEEGLDTLFNVRTIVSKIFDRNCNIISRFRNDNYVLGNVFRSGNTILEHVNKRLQD